MGGWMRSPPGAGSTSLGASLGPGWGAPGTGSFSPGSRARGAVGLGKAGGAGQAERRLFEVSLLRCNLHILQPPIEGVQFTEPLHVHYIVQPSPQSPFRAFPSPGGEAPCPSAASHWAPLSRMRGLLFFLGIFFSDSPGS